VTDFPAFVPQQRFSPTLALSPDGSRVAYAANASGQHDLYVAEVEGAGESRRLTRFTDRAVRDVAWSPDGSVIAFTADHHGDEQHQVFVVELAAAAFTDGGRTLVLTGNDRDERCRDVLLVDVATGETRRRVETTPGMWAAASVSPDGRWLLAAQAHGNADTDLHLLDLHDPDATTRCLTAHEGEVVHAAGPWAPDSSGFLLRTDAGREFTALARYDLTTQRVEPVAAPEWDVEQVTSTPDGSVIAWTVNESGASRVVVRRDGADVPLPDVPPGSVDALALSDDGTRLAFLSYTATRPGDVAVVELEAGTLRYVTDSRPPALHDLAAVAPRLVDYPTHDGRSVPAWLYVPAGEGPFPFVLSVHGGPEAQERPDYSYAGLYQYLLSQGIGVLAPNVRGSTGYGKTYQRLIHRDWGGDELRDLEHAALYLRSLGVADGDRVAVFGGSFGGFATLSCLSRLPGYWAAGVSIVGPSNLVTLASSVPATWRPLMRAWVGDPEDDREMLLERSPITYADRIVAPLMVVQGANDPRVVRAESDQIVEALRARGVEVRYDVYDDEGHGFTNRANEIRALTDVSAFLVDHLVTRAA
jgi:dipeptidyl aminopeptidase/acylaminoacyl peptidase